MEMEQRDSGLVVPKEESKRSTRQYKHLPPLEVQDEEERKRVAEVLSQLWDVLDLSSPSSFRVRPEGAYDAHYQAWCYLGEMLLGDDCPEKEVLT